MRTSTASGHLLGRAPCGLPRVLRDGKGLRVLAAFPLNGFSFVLLKRGPEFLRLEFQHFCLPGVDGALLLELLAQHIQLAELDL